MSGYNKKTGIFAKVKGTPEQIWEALSGKLSNPERALYYHR
jgi:hypothetical protein